MTMIYALLCKAQRGGKIMSRIYDPRSKMLSSDEEMVEIVEIIENCDDYSDLDEDNDISSEYEFDYDY